MLSGDWVQSIPLRFMPAHIQKQGAPKPAFKYPEIPASQKTDFVILKDAPY